MVQRENDIHGFYIFDEVFTIDLRTQRKVKCKITYIGWAGFEKDTFYHVEILEGGFKGDIIKGLSYKDLLLVK